MKITDHIKNSKETLFSLEILPPLKGGSIQSIFDMLDPFMEFNPPFIDVTYHREEYVFKKHANGLLEKKTVRKRPGTVSICAAIQNHYNVDAVPHIICGGFTKEETENALIELSFLGIDNVLVLRGDAVKTEPGFVPDVDGHAYASDLLKQVVALNQGEYLDNDIENSSSTDFCIGVAGYPEKHFEAPNLNIDLQYLKKKVDSGADYIVTQMFFDNTHYFNFVEKCRELGITVPIIPGIKPITTKSQLTVLPKVFHIDLPDELVGEIIQAKDNQAVRQIGTEWAIAQSKELKASGVPVLHYYTMSKNSVVLDIAREVF